MPNKPRVILFDLESSNLNAEMGYILCGAYKILGEKKVNYVSINQFKRYRKDPTNDIEVVKVMKNVIESADILVGHYSTRFDLPLLQSKALVHNLGALPRPPHVDTWRVSKYRLKLRYNSLANLSKFLKCENKTVLHWDIWSKAQAMDGNSIKYVIDHCIQDVIVLEDVYNKLLPIIDTHPSMAILRGGSKHDCNTCGSSNVQRRGRHVALKTIKQRFQCKDCGSWFTGPTLKIS